MSRRDHEEPTYSLGAVVRLTGLSAHVLRAWERRYGAVQPLRTEGGTRRYRESDVARLHRLRAAVASGHPIGDVARLPEAELERRLELVPSLPRPPLEPILAAIDQLDAAEAERLLGRQLSALGSTAFVRSVASPLLHAIGDRWQSGRLCIASEHLASALLRSLLGAMLRATGAASHAAPILFTTPPGERHELGALMAAAIAVDAGGRPIYLGPDLPIEEVVEAAAVLGAAAVAIGVCRVDGAEFSGSLRVLRSHIPPRVEVWVGGPGTEELALPPGAARVADVDDLERKVALLVQRSETG